MPISDVEKFTLRQKITDYAKSLGFDLVGFSPAKIEEKYLAAFEDWLKEGREGSMDYMRKIEQRRDLTKILPGAKTVIVFGLNYYHEQPPLPRGHVRSQGGVSCGVHGRIARYAYGRDYHKVIGKKLKMVEKFIVEHYAELNFAQHQRSSENCARAQFLSEKTASVSRSVSEILRNQDLQLESRQSIHCSGLTIPARLPDASTSSHQACTNNVHAYFQNKYTNPDSSRSARASLSHRKTPSPSHLPSNFLGQDPPILTKSYVDTGPLLERALAEQAGIGRIGKNGLLISEKFGSWIFLSEIITTLDLNFGNESHSQSLEMDADASLSANPSPGRDSDLETCKTAASLTVTHSAHDRMFNAKNIASPVDTLSVLSHSPWSQTPLGRWSSPTEKSFNICGNCTRCMTACPTGAIIAPGVVDSRLCISYLTIENRKKIPPKLVKIIKKTKRLYGCDICQEVCPHNQARAQASALSCPSSSECPRGPSAARNKHDYKTKKTASPDPLSGLLTPIAGSQLNLKKLLAKKGPLSSDAAFLLTFAGSPLMRAKRRGLARTAKIFTAP